MPHSASAVPETDTVYNGLFSRVALKRFQGGHDMPWHAHAHACMCTVLSGGMLESVGDTTSDFTPGAFIFKPSGVRHRNKFSAAGGVVLSLELSEHELNRFGDRVIPDHHLSFRSARVRSLGRQIAAEVSTGAVDFCTAMVIEGLSLELIAELARKAERQSAGMPRWLRQLHDRLSVEYAVSHTIEDYATLAGVHPSYLARTFKAHFGISIGRFIRQLRIRYATAQLSGTNNSLAAIAFSAGFADQSHFTHAFRRETGVSPGAFRRQRGAAVY